MSITKQKTYTLIAYGIARDILGGSSFDIELGADARISDLAQKLLELYPQFGDLRHLRFAVNEEYAEPTQRILPTDEIVLIPPVSGG